MELGEKLKQARLEAGFSQRQLCGDVITRNMLSQIENGSAKPSMGTLRYLAERLEKPVSYFLEEDAVTSPNQAVMARTRAAFSDARWDEMESALDDYRKPDTVFDPEYQLLKRLLILEKAQQALDRKQNRLAEQLLGELGTLHEGYCFRELERRRLLLLAKAQPKQLVKAVRLLPNCDEELLLRAEAALQMGDMDRSSHLLEAAEHRDVRWYILRGETHLGKKHYQSAISCFLKAEERSAPQLERCYRELGNFERAYYYACKQR
jgi:transcriptional regulator with XRE-family HTH domain